MPRCSIVIPVYNQASLTRQCLDGLLASPETRNQELIVVDDCSQDGTAELLASYGNAIRVIRHEVNLGYGQGVNDGTALASSEYVVQLNNDTIPIPGWLDALCQYADSHPKAAAVGSKLLNMDGSVQYAGIVFCSQRRPWHLYRWFPPDHPAVHKSRPFQALTGTSLLVRKSVFTQVGGFDSSLRNTYNDVDFCLGQLGYENHFCHKSVLYHLEGGSKAIHPEVDPNCRRFLERWQDRIREDEWDYYSEDGLVQIRRHADNLEVVVSPLLGPVNDQNDLGEKDRLMLRQSRQISILLREYVLLRLKTLSAEAGQGTVPDPLFAEAEASTADQPSSLSAHQELLQLVNEVLDHDNVRNERDVLKARFEQWRSSLPGRLYRTVRRLVQQKSA